MLNVIMLNIIMLSAFMLIVIMVNVIMLSVIMLSAFMLSAFMLNVVAYHLSLILYYIKKGWYISHLFNIFRKKISSWRVDNDVVDICWVDETTNLRTLETKLEIATLLSPGNGSDRDDDNGSKR